MQQVLNAVDVSASAATLEVGTVNMGTVLATITLAKPSFTLAAATLTLAGVPKSGNGAANGLAVAARIKDGSGTIRVSGLTVGTSGSDINLSSTNVLSGYPVTINSGTITHAP